jgi:hypothetical protein
MMDGFSTKRYVLLKEGRSKLGGRDLDGTGLWDGVALFGDSDAASETV